MSVRESKCTTALPQASASWPLVLLCIVNKRLCFSEDAEVSSEKTDMYFLLLIVFIVLLFYITIMSKDKNKPRALVLYAMDYKEWDSAFRQELSKGEENYKRWFLSKAKPIALPDSIYNEVFLKSSVISTGITNILLEDTYHEFKESSSLDQIYFVLNPDPFLWILKQSMYSEYITPEIDSFSNILKDIANSKIYVVAEYNKHFGWFDYNKLYEQKQKFKQQHETEIKQVESRLRKEK